MKRTPKERMEEEFVGGRALCFDILLLCSVRLLRRWNKFVGGGGDSVAAPAVKLPDCW